MHTQQVTCHVGVGNEKNDGRASSKRNSPAALAALRWRPIAIASGFRFSRQPLQL
jgi:hypothetical protein